MSLIRENLVGFSVVGVFLLGICSYLYVWTETHIEFTSCNDIEVLIESCRAWGRAEMVNNEGVLLRVTCARETVLQMCLDDECYGPEDVYRHGDPVRLFTDICRE
jgi:hypothetical protein